MSLVLDEFYQNLKVSLTTHTLILLLLTTPPQTVGVSSLVGTGMQDFFTLLQESREEFLR